MTQDRMTALFFEMFSGLPRQGPGDEASTLKALAQIPNVTAETRVLDLGCGTGLQTRVLAQNSPAHIVAIDKYPPFIAELQGHAKALGLEDRLDARVGDITALDLPARSFDLIWCEGAIWVAGFETGLREWCGLLAEGGHMAVTEACWIRPAPPTECLAYWEQEYPSMRDVPALLRVISDCGYETVDHFTLPASSWWDDYYEPLQRNIAKFRDRHRGESDAQEIADQSQREIDIWHRYSEFYGYEFFVMRRPVIRSE